MILYLIGLLPLGIIPLFGYIGFKMGRGIGLAIGILIGISLYVIFCEMLRSHYYMPNSDKSLAIVYLAVLWPYMLLRRQNEPCNKMAS